MTFVDHLQQLRGERARQFLLYFLLHRHGNLRQKKERNYNRAGPSATAAAALVAAAATCPELPGRLAGPFLEGAVKGAGVGETHL